MNKKLNCARKTLVWKFSNKTEQDPNNRQPTLKHNIQTWSGDRKESSRPWSTRLGHTPAQTETLAGHFQILWKFWATDLVVACAGVEDIASVAVVVVAFETWSFKSGDFQNHWVVD